MIKGRFLLIVLFLIAVSCANNDVAQEARPLPDLYAGSTPCDSLIKGSIPIRMDTTCEFIKWELQIDRRMDSGTFKLSVLYGESQPNTNGFKQGGHLVQFEGNYSSTSGVQPNPKSKIYHLRSPELQAPLHLFALDSNVLHFAGQDNKLITGNGGFGYVLNRVTH